MRIVPEISGMQIVLVGQFNPAIFTPAWFVHNKLLREGLAESAQVQVIHPQIADFTADWLHLQVTNQQFLAETQQAPYARLSDLVARTFSECLHHTPLTALGINRTVHFLVSDEDTRSRLGNILVPPDPWSRFTKSWVWAVDTEGWLRSKCLIARRRVDRKADRSTSRSSHRCLSARGARACMSG